jgi:hypothetical protein
VLADIYNRFTEGFDAADLRDAVRTRFGPMFVLNAGQENSS